MSLTLLSDVLNEYVKYFKDDGHDPSVIDVFLLDGYKRFKVTHHSGYYDPDGDSAPFVNLTIQEVKSDLETDS